MGITVDHSAVRARNRSSYMYARAAARNRMESALFELVRHYPGYVWEWDDNKLPYVSDKANRITAQFSYNAEKIDTETRDVVKGATYYSNGDVVYDHETVYDEYIRVERETCYAEEKYLLLNPSAKALYDEIFSRYADCATTYETEGSTRAQFQKKIKNFVIYAVIAVVVFIFTLNFGIDSVLGNNGSIGTVLFVVAGAGAILAAVFIWTDIRLRKQSALWEEQLAHYKESYTYRTFLSKCQRCSEGVKQRDIYRI